MNSHCDVCITCSHLNQEFSSQLWRERCVRLNDSEMWWLNVLYLRLDILVPEITVNFSKFGFNSSSHATTLGSVCSKTDAPCGNDTSSAVLRWYYLESEEQLVNSLNTLDCRTGSLFIIWLSFGLRSANKTTAYLPFLSCYLWGTSHEGSPLSRTQTAFRKVPSQSLQPSEEEKDLSNMATRLVNVIGDENGRHLRENLVLVWDRQELIEAF